MSAEGPTDTQKRSKHLLVIDDDKMIQGLLRDFFSNSGWTCKFASNANSALEILRNQAVDLILSDVKMPGMDGVQFMKEVKQKLPKLDFIIMTGYTADYSYVDIIRAGATDYMAKPFNLGELKAKITRIERERQLLENCRKSNERLELTMERIQDGLRTAANVQQALLPKKAPIAKGVDSTWEYTPCEIVSGDIFNILLLDENHIALYVLDVMGHGLSAAMLTVTLSHVLTPFSQQGGILKRALATPPYYEIVSPREVASQLNRQFPLMNQTNQFFTFIYGIFDLRNRCFKYINAGHPIPIHISSSDVTPVQVTQGMPIGIDIDATYEETEIYLSKNDALILYTDGILEARNPNNDHLALNGIVNFLKNHNGEDIKSNVQAIVQFLDEFAQGAPFTDDCTIVGFQVT